ncbi:hypothetical protein F5Y06DRAFT_305787 [Hypoxylon sp. FL0890]|nr:hypothetical protein F5Y06DRAFT_305787 [Hypoxylon sp. FL0890]
MAKTDSHDHLDPESTNKRRHMWTHGRPPQLNSTNPRTSQSAEQGRLDTMPNPPSLNHPLTPSPLFTRLTMTMCRALDSKSRSFLPQDQLNSLTPLLVKEELKRALPTLSEAVLGNYTTRIMGVLTTNDASKREYSTRKPWSLGGEAVQKPRLLRTFTILVLLNKVESIPSFISGGFTDSLLPIDYALFRGKIRSPPPSLVALLKRCFDNWPMRKIEAFIETQWAVLSPFLNKSNGDVSLYNFCAQTILPIFDGDTTSKPYINIGGYSTVRKIRIDLGHHDFGKDQDEPYFALKKLRSRCMKDFKREVLALRPFAISPNPHVVNLLAAFQHGGSFYLLFPWAEGGNLRSFWIKNNKPIPDCPLLRWIAEQCLGIATALLQIHHGHCPAEESKVRGGDRPTHIPCYGLHGDVKPANILLFKENSHSDKFIWALSDFGLGKVHALKDRHAGDRAIGYSPTYRAPELDIKGTIDRSYDIWSLGCVFLEFLTWLLHGWEGVESFALSRVASGNSDIKGRRRDDGFFILTVSRQGAIPTAELKPSVVLWIDNLAVDKAASPYILDMLSLTRNNLLDTNWETRASSSLVVEKLQCLRQKCLEDPAYTVALPWPRKPPWSNNKLESLHEVNYYQAQAIQVNMAHIPSPRELNCPGLVSTPSQDMYWPDLSEQPFTIGNVTDLFKTPVDATSPMENDANSHLPDSLSDHCLHYPLNQYMRDTHISPISDQALSFQHPHESPNSRRRTLDDVIGPSDMGEARKKKARKKQKLLTQDAPRNKLPDDEYRQLSHANTKDALKPTGMAGEEKLFACPFHKRNPTRYSTKAWKACIGPGWKISRLKEHIYRKHYVSGYRCDRCLFGFKNRSDLHRHSRSDPPCQKRDFDAESDTIDESQKAQIQKKPRGVSDEQKWNEIYRIIFKLDSAAEVPSPYCDTIAGGVDPLGDKSNDRDSLADFETYLHRLADDDNQEDVVGIRNCLDLVQRFQQRRTGAQPVIASDMPTLTYDCSDDATRTSESQDFPSLTSVDDNIGVANAEELNDLPYWDSSFMVHFNEVFSSDKTYCFPDSLKLGVDGGGIQPEE